MNKSKNQKLPRISVVTPSYKSKSTIKQTVLSVLSQGYPDLEYIVVDGAGDDTASLLEKYANSLAFWCSEPDGGQYDAIRKGFARATGEVLFWLNADDVLFPKALWVVGEVFRDFEDIAWLSTLAPGSLDHAGYVCGTARIPGFSKRAFLDGFNVPGVRVRGRFVQQESTFFRKSLWDQVEVPFSGCNVAGDFALWCSFYRLAELHGLEYPLGAFRHMAGQRSEDLQVYKREALACLNDLRAAEGLSAVALSEGRPGPAGWFARRAEGLRSYAGKYVLRRRRRHPDASWIVEERRFSP